MKPILISLFLLIASQYTYAQMDFAVVAARDGEVNVRQGPGVNKALKGKLVNGDVVFAFGAEGKSEWWEIDYAREKGDNLRGYIHSSGLRLINQMKPGKVVYRHKDSLILQLDTIKVVMVRQPFVPAQHKFRYNSNKEISRIDGHSYWGTDGEMPTTAYKSITVITGNKRYDLDKFELYLFYNPNFYKTALYVDPVADRIYISAFNSDGAGGYNLLYCIEHGKYLFWRTFEAY